MTPAQRRRRALAARRRNRWETEDCPPAPQEVIEMAEWRMHVIDNSEPWWRALFNYCYSFQIVDGMRDENVEPLQARELLEENRQARQELYSRSFNEMPKRGSHSSWQSNES